MEILHLEKENFKELVKNEKKVLVDFYAEWCGPCKMLAPVLESVESKVKVIKVNTDEFDELSREYGVMSIPTLVLLEDGKEVKRNVGLLSKNELEKFIEE